MSNKLRNDVADIKATLITRLVSVSPSMADVEKMPTRQAITHIESVLRDPEHERYAEFKAAVDKAMAKLDAHLGNDYD